MNQAESIQKRFKGLFAEVLGVRLLEATKERVLAEMTGRDDLCTLPGITHGGAIMAFADTLGAVGTVLNLPDGAGTSTIESKTNFFAAVPSTGTMRAECTPLHVGGSTMVWQTRITRDDGRLVAQVVQTQIVLLPRK
ncbi:MAG: PaaI family thioesterase [Candidatus Lambdaproteobacteria bacterium]|nr:PaaI family thioesterase [Candidatus Lambdaproteobacteria bacterium]